MISIFNQVQLIGRLGVDPEIKLTSQGTRVSTLRVATNEKIKQSNGDWKEITQWHSCVVWGDLNNVVDKLCVKGTLALFTGSLIYREYIDNQEVRRIIAEIKVNHILVLDNLRSLESSSNLELAETE